MLPRQEGLRGLIAVLLLQGMVFGIHHHFLAVGPNHGIFGVRGDRRYDEQVTDPKSALGYAFVFARLQVSRIVSEKVGKN